MLLAASLAPAPPSGGAEDGSQGRLYPMVYPLLGTSTLTDSFGDPRGGGRSHAGVDILAERMTPVVAVADGEVSWVHDERGGNCCDVALVHEDGWRSRYIHLNNDTPGTDDGRAVGIAPGVRVGARLKAGEVIGWVGDSGNAEETVSHLHFELRRPDGSPVDPYPSLVAARQGRSLVPEPRAERREEPRGALWRWLGRGRRPAEPEAPVTSEGPRELPAPALPETPPPTIGPDPPAPGLDAPPMPPAEGLPSAPPPPGAAGEGPLAMAHTVELVAVDDDCCEDVIGEEEEAAEERRDVLGCFGLQKKPARSAASP